ncbi:MAG: toll/interleukin-1 receptor domain-containing protein, partial [Pseudomonadota bacterium]
MAGTTIHDAQAAIGREGGAVIAASPSSTGPRVFISYARKDLTVANELRDGLVAAGVDAYLDVFDIAPGEDWRGRLGELIGTAEKIVFLISPDSVASKTCDWEVNEAERQGKPILPVVIRETPLETIPPRLTRLHLTFARTDAERLQRTPELVEALSSDLKWERDKTDLNAQAEAWAQAGKPARLLIWREEPLKAAEKWRDGHPANAPAPTETQLAFIADSRTAYSRRQNWIRAALVAIALVTSAATAVAYLQRETALENLRQAKITESRMLAQAAQEDIAVGDAGDAIALARLALPRDPDVPTEQFDPPFISDGMIALTDSIAPRRELAALRGHEASVQGATVLADGRILSWS